jgi:hypothetical protein
MRYDDSAFENFFQTGFGWVCVQLIWQNNNDFIMDFLGNELRDTK